MEPIARFFGDGYDGMAGVLDVDAPRTGARWAILNRTCGAATLGGHRQVIYVSARKEARQ